MPGNVESDLGPARHSLHSLVPQSACEPMTFMRTWHVRVGLEMGAKAIGDSIGDRCRRNGVELTEADQSAETFFHPPGRQGGAEPRPFSVGSPRLPRSGLHNSGPEV